MKRILVINPGATSTKIAVYEDENEVMRVGIDHDAAEMDKHEKIVDQMPFRRDIIMKTLEEKGFKLEDFDAICGRGGLLKHIPSGTYKVTDAVIEDIKNPPYGEHAANLGSYISKELADKVGIPAFFVDPVAVDELEDVARYSGLKGMERQSFWHALNQKAVCREAAKQIGKPYEELNIIGVHLGGGVSVAAHKHGKTVDLNNVKDEGAMGMDRGGSLPANALVNLCYSGKTKEEVKRIIDECYKKAHHLIEEHMDVLHTCANVLIQKEKIGTAVKPAYSPTPEPRISAPLRTRHLMSTMKSAWAHSRQSLISWQRISVLWQLFCVSM